MKKRTYLRGDIYLAELSPSLGSEQSGLRPVVVLQNNIGNHYAPTLIVAGMTTQTRKKLRQPTHYLIWGNSALHEPSVVLLEQLRTIDKKRIKTYLGKVTAGEMQGIERALRVSLALSDCKEGGE